MDPVIAPGLPAPPVDLPDLNGAVRHLEDQRGRLTVVNFWSVECPWSAHADPSIVAAARAADADLWTIACCAGEPLDRIGRAAIERGLSTVIPDPTQAVADRYQAIATPHVFVVDAKGILRYRGAPDDTGFGLTPPTQDYLAEALRAIRDGRPIEPVETPARGCAITRHFAG